MPFSDGAPRALPFRSLAVLAFLRALSGSPQLTAKSIRMESLRANAADLLSGIEQMESAGFLKDFLLAEGHDAVAAYEAILLEIDWELARRKREPFFLTYIVDATVTANFPLGFIENPEHPERKALFLRFRDYLLSPPVQRRLAAFGWRTETGDFPDAGGFGIREDWGLNPNRTLSELRLPAPDVFGEALDLYRTGFRKPAFTFFCLDFSGSMRGKGETELKQAMRILLHTEDFARYGIDTGRRDRLQILAFSDRILGKWESDAASPDGLLPIDDALQILSPAGNSDLHACLLQALSFLLETPGMDAYAPATVLMTDGRSPAFAGSALEWEWRMQESRRKIPVFTVLPEIKAQAENSQDPLDVQRHQDMVRFVDRFERRVHDLRTSRMVALQALPQIRLIQHNDQLLVERIQGSILHTIPL